MVAVECSDSLIIQYAKFMQLRQIDRECPVIFFFRNICRNDMEFLAQNPVTDKIRLGL